MSNETKKELGLFDIFALSTEAIFSSGFFLLPGLAAHHTGSSVILAYFLARISIMPAMFSVAEILLLRHVRVELTFFLIEA